MKTLEQIAELVNADKEIQKNISKKLRYFDTDQFISTANAYIQAIKEKRMFCIITSVSKSGMSRNIKFISTEKASTENQYWHRNYNCFFIALGYTESRSKDGSFSIGGCGMDMVFHTNYSIIHSLERLGFVTVEECNHLAQQTPSVF